MLKKKMRIQLLSSEGVTMDDRLVEQTTEFYNGPKEKHEGMLRLEVNLENTEDITNFKSYLDKLTGLLPIPEKKTRGRKANGEIKSSESDLLKALEDAKVKGIDQDKLIKYLRDLGYRFVTTQLLEDLEIKEKIGISEAHGKKYTFMVRLLKRAKDPGNDKFDPMMAFGIKIIGKSTSRVIVYFNGEYKERLKCPATDNLSFHVKKAKLTIFPDFMNYKERTSWRKEDRQLAADPDKQPSRSYLRWQEHVIKPKE